MENQPLTVMENVNEGDAAEPVGLNIEDNELTDEPEDNNQK